MKRKTLFLALALSATSMFAAKSDLPVMGDISKVLELQPGFDFGFTLPTNAESALNGCVGDFNKDGIDDFILTGLHGADGKAGFFSIYLGKEEGAPILTYRDEAFPIAGNGSIDCGKSDDGSWLVAIQGGSSGNWVNPFKANVYKLVIDNEIVTFDLLTSLTDKGCGRGSIRFLDVNGDGLLDIYQNGWIASGEWTTCSNVYINQNNTGFELQKIDSKILGTSNTHTTKGDIDGDGKEDLLITYQGKGLYAYFNNGDGTFREVRVTPFLKADRAGIDGGNIPGGEDRIQADLIDVDNDGILEAALSGVNDATGGTWNFFIKIYKLNEETTEFTEIAPTNKAGEKAEWVGGQNGNLIAGDFDGDGNMDMIVGAENSPYEIGWKTRTYFYNGNGKGGFDLTECSYDKTNNPNGIIATWRRAQAGCYLVGDFNGDGKEDFVQAGATYGFNRDTNLVRYYMNVRNYITPENIASATLSETMLVRGTWDAASLNLLKDKLDGNQISVTFKNAVFSAGVEDVFAAKNPNCLKFFSNEGAVPTDWTNVVKGDKTARLTLVDNGGAETYYPFNNTKKFTADAATYTRNYPVEGWSSICLPFMVESLPDNVVAEEFAGSVDNTVNFTGVQQLNANVPYVLNITGNGNKVFEGRNVEINVTSEPMGVNPSGNYLFKGTFSRIADAADLFILDSNGLGFSKSTSNNYVPAFRGYIEGNGASEVRKLSFGTGGNATNMNQDEVNNELTVYSENGVLNVNSVHTKVVSIYGIDGCLIKVLELNAGNNVITGLAKGLYLIENQKVIIK